MHGLRRELLEAQAASIELPLTIVSLPPAPDHTAYNTAILACYNALKTKGIQAIAFGDIFLDDLRVYREKSLAQCGLRGLFPLWKEDTRQLVQDLAESGIQATVIAADATKLDQSFLGRTVNADFVADLPAGVDPCGENGEYHTLVWDAPFFTKPIRFIVGKAVHRGYTGTEAKDGEGFYFLDLLAP